MYHAVIQCDSDGVVLLDKGSLNKTKLNKVLLNSCLNKILYIYNTLYQQKNLKKGVAYFLDENAVLMFGEVLVNYYVHGKPSKTINEINSNSNS